MVFVGTYFWQICIALFVHFAYIFSVTSLNAFIGGMLGYVLLVSYILFLVFLHSRQHPVMM